ncbi:hypothetical protein [Cohnella hongkongensis]|uniref:Uncharacterized protein n=1 Tax=Cohnella hongkongensis TaxID=178337 RepID=A0ABV9FJA5_9BACL
MTIILITVAAIILQIYLCRRENKRLGLILPAISLLISIIFTLLLYSVPDGSTASIVMQLVSIFLISNIPTLILLAIYIACRITHKRKKQIDIMRIQDLE